MLSNQQLAQDLERFAPLYERVRTVIPDVEWPIHVPHISAINALKKERNAVILAHYYQEDEIQDLADVVGDSLALARAAQQADCEVVAFCGRCARWPRFRSDRRQPTPRP